MTKKDYMLLATTLRYSLGVIRQYPEGFTEPLAESFFITSLLVDALAKDREDFKVEKFMEAAGINWNK